MQDVNRRQTVLTPSNDCPAWRSAGLRYHAQSHYLAARFGGRVQKISVDAGFTCPNVDGSVGVRGCNFCNIKSFSPSRRSPRTDIAAHIQEGMRRARRRYACDMFLAYFQPATNTHAHVNTLRRVYSQALSIPSVVGIAIGTRPDCVPDEVLDLIQELAQRTYVSLELGIQTIHPRSLDWMNRCHDYQVAVDAVQRSRNRGFDIGSHLILGIPGESREDMLQTVREMGRLNLDSVKFHNLYATRRTRLAQQVARGEVSLMDRDQYLGVLVECLEWLPPTIVVERICGDVPRQFLVEPTWCLDKAGTLAALRAELSRRDTWQGKRHQRSC